MGFRYLSVVRNDSVSSASSIVPGDDPAYVEPTNLFSSARVTCYSPTAPTRKLEHEEGIEPVVWLFCRQLTYHLSIRANLVRLAGFGPARPFGQRGLSPPRLPVPSQPQNIFQRMRSR